MHRNSSWPRARVLRAMRFRARRHRNSRVRRHRNSRASVAGASVYGCLGPSGYHQRHYAHGSEMRMRQ